MPPRFVSLEILKELVSFIGEANPPLACEKLLIFLERISIRLEPTGSDVSRLSLEFSLPKFSLVMIRLAAVFTGLIRSALFLILMPPLPLREAGLVWLLSSLGFSEFSYVLFMSFFCLRAASKSTY